MARRDTGTGPDLNPMAPETGALAERIAFFRQHSAAPNTNSAYRSDLAHFAAYGGFLPAWTVTAVTAPDQTMPGTPAEHLEAYLAYYGDKLKISTLRRRVAAINKWNLAAGCPAPGQSATVKAVLAGIARAQRRGADKATRDRFRLKKAPPLLEEHVRLLLDVLGETLRDRRDRALFLTAWCIGGRRSEITNLSTDDLQFDGDGVDVRIEFSKTDQEADGAYLGIPRIGGRACAVTALEDWLHTAAIERGPVFRRVDRWQRAGTERLHDDSLTWILRQRLLAAGVPMAQRFTSHSFRAGMITQGIVNNESEHEVRERSRHKSREVFDGYVRRVTDKKNSFVGRMLKRL